MDTSLIINATNSGKKVTKAITNINHDKDNTILKTFAQKVNALTTNNYVDATRVNKMSVNEEGGGSGGGTIVVDMSNATSKGLEITDIEGGKRFTFSVGAAVSGYIDVTIG